MALLVVHRDIWNTGFYRQLLHSAFDKIELTDRYNDRFVFRVYHSELPDDETIIEPSFYEFSGVYPFVIDWGLPNNKQ